MGTSMKEGCYLFKGSGIKDCPKIFEIVHNLKYFWTILYS